MAPTEEPLYCPPFRREDGMSRLSLLLALAVLQACSGGARAQTSPRPHVAAKPDQPFNVGFVLYTKGKVPGTLDARWMYANAYSGRGVATGGAASGGFAGRYHVRYYLETGEFSDEYDLDIEKRAGGDFYDVSWISNGAVSAKGVGMEVANGSALAVGWRRVAD
jgi:hypothetical protein